MPAPANKVTVEVTGGPSQDVTWTSGMSAQAALELAWNAINSTSKFTFGLQYYGTSLGYLVFMINETFDSFLSSAEPYFYWEFLVNGTAQSKGIDGTTLASGDVVTFTFTTYDPGQHAGTTLEAKNKFQKSQMES
jgi:hypothetical protein